MGLDKYRAKIVDAEVRLVGKKETRAAVVVFENLEPGDREGKTEYYNGWLSEGALPYTLMALESCGFTGDDLTQLKEMCVGNEVILCMDWEESNDPQYEDQYKIKFINKIGGGKKLDGTDMLSFAEKMKANIALARKKNADSNGGSEKVPFKPKV